MEPVSGRGAAPENQSTLLTYALLTGLTPLIPVPFVDDLVRDYFRSRLVRELAEARGVALGDEAVETLTRQPGGSCLGGCYTGALVYPLRVIFRKVFYFLEWKRAVDLTSASFHFGYLVDVALSEGLLGPGGAGTASVAAVRQAIDQVCREAPIRPVEAAVAAAFRQSKGLIVRAVRTLAQAVSAAAGTRDGAAVARAVSSVDEEEQREIRGVVDRLQAQTQAIPESHFRAMRERLLALLERPSR